MVIILLFRDEMCTELQCSTSLFNQILDTFLSTILFHIPKRRSPTFTQFFSQLPSCFQRQRQDAGLSATCLGPHHGAAAAAAGWGTHRAGLGTHARTGGANAWGQESHGIWQKKRTQMGETWWNYVSILTFVSLGVVGVVLGWFWVSLYVSGWILLNEFKTRCPKRCAIIFFRLEAGMKQEVALQ